MTDRDILRDEIERLCIIQQKNVKETDSCIEVIPGGPKYIFTPEGVLRSVIKMGVSYKEHGIDKLRGKSYGWKGEE